MDDNYEILCEMGRAAAQNIDTGRYAIGDLARQIKKSYGRDTIGRFAKDIGVPKARAQEYRQVCDFWSNSQRQHIFERFGGMISYTHLRHAMRLKNNLEAFLFIEECGNNGYTCDEAAYKLQERLGKPVPAEKLLDGLGFVRDIRGQRVLVEVDVAILPALHDAWQRKQPVRLVVYRTEDTPDINPVIAILGSGYERRIDTRLVKREDVPA